MERMREGSRTPPAVVPSRRLHEALTGANLVPKDEMLIRPTGVNRRHSSVNVIRASKAAGLPVARPRVASSRYRRNPDSSTTRDMRDPPSRPASSLSARGSASKNVHAAANASEETALHLAHPRSASKMNRCNPDFITKCDVLEPPSLERPASSRSGRKSASRSVRAAKVLEETGVPKANPGSASTMSMLNSITTHDMPAPPSSQSSPSNEHKLQVCLEAANKEIERLQAQLGQHKKLRQHVALRLLKEDMTMAKVSQIIGVDPGWQSLQFSPLAKAAKHGCMDGWTEPWMAASNIACEQNNAIAI